MRFRATTSFESGSVEDARALVQAWNVSEGLTIYVESLPDPADNFTVIEGEAQAGITPMPPPDPAPTDLAAGGTPPGIEPPPPADTGPAPTA
jgi:hypothetical protein